jgi:Ni,Fe-hydrogenase I cytochrome b subunit
MIGLQLIQLYLLMAKPSSKDKFHNFLALIVSFLLQLIIFLLAILKLHLYFSQPFKLPLYSLRVNSQENYNFLLKEVKYTNRFS